MADIFLSYANEDRARARVVVDALTSAGWSVWWDSDLFTGERYPRRLETELESALCVVVLWSVHSVRSEWVQSEATRANARKKLVPALIDAVARDVPLEFLTMQAAPLQDWEGDAADPVFAGFLAAVAEKTGHRAGTSSPTPVVPRLLRQLRARMAAPIAGFVTRADGMVLGLLLLAAIVQIGWLWRLHFNTAEKLFWGLSIPAAGLGWSLVRRLSFRPRWGTAPVSLLVTVTKLTAFVLLAGAWSFARYRVYRFESFGPRVSGIYIGRIDNDPDDGVQAGIVHHLEDFIAKRLDTGTIKVAPLGRRIASDAEARAYGVAGRAVLVLSGEIDRSSNQAVSSIRAHVTLVRPMGVFEAPGVLSARMGADVPELPLDSDLALAEDVLAQFFAGYSAYGDTKRRAEARGYFHDAMALLDHVPRDTTVQTPLQATLGTLHFFYANTLIAAGDTAAALAHYDSARALTLTPGTHTPRYVEPLNNLGVILLREHRVDSALRYLQGALDVCRTSSGSTRGVSCPYVSYNAGLALVEQRRYDSAGARFREAVVRASEPTAGVDGPDRRFIAYAGQQSAYSIAKLAENTVGPGRLDLYRSAERELDRAAASIRATSADTIPTKFKITRGRILIGFGRWDDAIAILTEAQRDGTDGPEVLLLLAIASDCKGGTAAAASLLARYQVLERDANELMRGLDQFKAAYQTCKPH